MVTKAPKETSSSIKIIDMNFKCSVMALAILLSGCTGSEPTFILKTDMPANFELKATAYYGPATGETCTAPPRKKGYIPDREFFTSELQKTAHTAVFDVPLAYTVGGCPLVLKSIDLNIEGQWGLRDLDIGRDIASLSFRDKPSANDTNAAITEDRIYDGECQWLFRTVGSQRNIRKILKCRAVDDQGQVMKKLAGGILRRDSLAGKTVKLAFKVAIEEEPYYDDAWLKTPKGWKPCTGRWGTNNEEYCTTPPQFTDFKMPDGRSCTVYPNCSE